MPDKMQPVLPTAEPLKTLDGQIREALTTLRAKQGSPAHYEQTIMTVLVERDVTDPMVSGIRPYMQASGDLPVACLVLCQYIRDVHPDIGGMMQKVLSGEFPDFFGVQYVDHPTRKGERKP